MTIPQWVKGLARLWGTEVRRFEKEIQGLQGTMGRIRDEGPDGAAIRSYHDNLPYREFSADVRTFHLAWGDLKPELKAIIWLDFKVPGSANKKIKKSGLSKTQYYRTRAEALEIIKRDFHLYANNSPEIP